MTNKSLKQDIDKVIPAFKKHELFKNIIEPSNLKSNFEQLAKQSWRIEDIIPDDAGFIVIFGQQKSYKSFLVLDMALSIANNVPYHGKETQQATVLYVAGEGQKGILKRIEAWRQVQNLPNIKNFYLEIKPIIISDNNSCDNLISFINSYPKALKPQIIIIDTIARSMNGDENGSGMSDFIAGCGKIQADTDCQVIAIHHTPKNGKTMRGWSGLSGAIDFSYQISKHNKIPMTAVLQADDVKDHSDKSIFYFNMVLHDTGLSDGRGKPITSLVPILNTELSPDIESNKLTGHRLKIYNALLSAMKKLDKKRITLEEWQNEYFVTNAKCYKRQYFSRERKILIESCHIIEDNGFYFPRKD